MNELHALRDLEQLRQEIDKIDAALAPLLDQRMDLSIEVAAYKKQKGMAVHQPQREARLLAGVAQGRRHPDALRCVYQAILAQSRALQERDSVAEA